VRRSLVFEGTETVLELGRVVEVDVPQSMLVLEQMKDGRWRLTYSRSLIPDFRAFRGIRLLVTDHPPHPGAVVSSGREVPIDKPPPVARE